MKKIISASVLSLLLFGAISLNEIETGKFEVRDTLEERFTNKVTGRKVTVKRAAEGEAGAVARDGTAVSAGLCILLRRKRGEGSPKGI